MPRASHCTIVVLAGLPALLWTASCFRIGAFTCSSHTDCTRAADGVCREGGCAYPDPACVPSGYRYSDHAAPDHAGRCVDEDAAGTSSGPDGTDETDGLEPLPDGCDGVDCSGAGQCVVVDDQPMCDCASGLHAAGASCLEDPCSTHDCIFVDALEGDDSNPGSREAPVASIGRALETVEDAAGTAVVLRRGRAWQGDVRLDGRVGHAELPFMLAAYGPVSEGRPVVGRVIVTDAAHVVVRDLESVPGPDDSGPCIQASRSEYVTIFDNVVRGCEARGIRFHDGVSHGVIMANRVHDVARSSGVSVADASWAMPEPTVVGDHHYIVDNLLIGPFGNEAGIHVNTSAGDIKVIGNRVTGTPETHGIRVVTGSAAWVLGNTVVASAQAEHTHAITSTGARSFVEGNVTQGNGGGVRLGGQATIRHNTLLQAATDADVHLDGSGVQMLHNLVLATGAPLLRVLSTPEDVIATADHNAYGPAGGAGLEVCAVAVSGQGSMSFSEWQETFDASSRCEVVPGVAGMLSTTDPLQWDTAWHELVPDPGWSGCDEDITPGAFDCDGERIDARLEPAPEVLAGDGLGWPPPLLVRLRYPGL